MSRVPSVVSTPDAVRAAVASQGGDGTMAPGGLTLGKLVDGGRAGKILAMYRKVVGVNAQSDYNLPHDLGVVPAWAILVATDNQNTPRTVIVANAFQFDKWTATEARVTVSVLVGGLAGTAMWFLIGGER